MRLKFVTYGNEARKICNRCGRKNLSEDDFSYKNRVTGRRQAYCRQCQNVMSRSHYAANKARYIANNRQKAARNKNRILELKRRPCSDCGQTFPPCVMDFDHRPESQKLGNINEMMRGQARSMRIILAEIAKCDVVCANCHRIRTHKRLGRHDTTCLMPS